MNRTTLALAASLLAVPSFAAAQGHPHLLYTASDVSALRSRAQSTHAAIYQALEGGTSSFLGTTIASDGTVTWPDGHTFNLGDRRDIGTSLMVFSFVWQIDGGDATWQLAHDWLMAVVSWGNFDLDGTCDLLLAHIVTGAAFAYDVLYPRLTDDERTRARQAILQNAQALMQGGLSGAGQWWEREFLMNHNWINHASVGIAALAVEGEVDASATDTLRGYAVQNVQNVMNATSGIGDGTWHEGLGYLAYGYLFHVPFVDALKRAGHEDLTDFPLLRAYSAVHAHAQIPEDPDALILTYADFYSFAEEDGLFEMRYLASRFGDGVAQASADRQAAAIQRNSYAPEAEGGVLEFLFYDPSVASTDLHSLPLDWYGSDLQGVVFRSGWDKGALLFAMKSGTYGGRSIWERLKAGDTSVGTLNFGHDHADDNGFWLYGNGSWLAPEAEGYGATNANQTWFHNSITIDGQNQLMEQGTSDEAQSYAWFGTRESSIAFHGSASDFAYAIGDGAALYPASMGMTRWDRHVLFLDRKVVLVRDVLEANQAHSYSWFNHFMQGASQDGSWIHGVGDNGQALGVAVVAPAEWTFSAVQQAPPRIVGLNPNGYVYSATVTNATPAPDVTFLTALVPIADAAWSSRPDVEPLDPSDPASGLTLRDGQRLAAAVFARLAGDDVRAGGYHLVGLAGVAEYAAGAPARALLVQGTLLEDGSGTLVTQDGTSSVLEADGLGSSVLALSGDALGVARIRAPSAAQVTWYGSPIPFSRDGAYVILSGLCGPGSAPGCDPEGSGSGAATVGDGSSAAAGGSTPVQRLAAGGCSAGGAAETLAGAGLLFAALRRRRSRKSS